MSPAPVPRQILSPAPMPSSSGPVSSNTIQCGKDVWSLAPPESYPSPIGYTTWTSGTSGKVNKYKLLPTNQPYKCSDGGTNLPDKVSPYKMLTINTLEIAKKNLSSSNAAETGTPGIKSFVTTQLNTAYSNIYKRR